MMDVNQEDKDQSEESGNLSQKNLTIQLKTQSQNFEIKEKDIQDIYYKK